MNFFEIYLMLVLFCMILWPIGAIYQYKNGYGVKDFDNAVSDLKAVNEVICASTGVVTGSFAIALIAIFVFLAWIISLPIVYVIKLVKMLLL